MLSKRKIADTRRDYERGLDPDYTPTEVLDSHEELWDVLQRISDIGNDPSADTDDLIRCVDLATETLESC